MDGQPIIIAVYIVIFLGNTVTDANSYTSDEQEVCEDKQLRCEKSDPAIFVDTETRIVLVGRTGDGKSSTANSILGRKHFKSKSHGKSVTKRCEYIRDSVQGKTLALVDNPGIFDTEVPIGETLFEIAKSLILASPGPHVFLLVLSTQRFTKEIQTSVRYLRRAFGEDFLRYTIIVITRKDDLDHDDIGIDKFVKGVPKYMKDLLDTCDGRYSAFNNRLKLDGEENQAQVRRLLEMVHDLIESNGGKYYNSHIQEQIEDVIKKELMVIDEEKSVPATFVDTETRIILVGRTGDGKSSTANGILGRKHFESKPHGQSVTKRCEYIRERVQGKTLALVDTPGIFDTETPTGETLFEITKSLIIASPGPHVFLLVLSTQRFTKEIQTSVKILRKTFGEDVLRYTIIAFTRKDDLDHDGIDIDEFVKDIPEYMKGLLDTCDGRYIAFNNRLELDGEENQAQVRRLLEMADDLIESNGGEYYTSQIQEKIEDAIMDELRAIDEEIEEILSDSSDEEREEEKYWAREKIRQHTVHMSGSCTDGSLVGGVLGAVTGAAAGFLYGGPIGALYGAGIGAGAGYGLGRLYRNACNVVETEFGA